MNTATQAVNFKIDDLLASRLTNAADDGVAILDPSRPSIIQVCQILFVQSFPVNNGTAVDQAVKKARLRTTPASVRATNSNLIISFQVLDKRHDASNALKSSSLERAKRAPGDRATLISKNIKATNLSDKSEFRWQVMVNEHPSDNDEKKMSRVKRKAV